MSLRCFIIFKYKRTKTVGHKKRKESSDMKLISYCLRLNSLSSHFVETIKSILESYWHYGEKEKSKLQKVCMEEEEEKQGRENGRLETEIGIK
jgi:hypothetical protein